MKQPTQRYDWWD